MVQVLVPISAWQANDDERQYYTYINESDYPGANRFNVGDKVKLNYEEFDDSPYIHRVDGVELDLDVNQWKYWVVFDPNFSHPDPMVQAWIENKEGFHFFLEYFLVAVQCNTTARSYYAAT
ncbi:hypothetical protein PN466_02090 [Roseofilum reptotaenium CS-1145]|uniref:Uncharacterized protein n=1 Tax=Roseofilum reptotaenium AO1-A TaxID=1925591 RepID=A0A1L9QN31_9CYAN|nr:hypothetical protein [Roseofilum reptotaenium]MDB9515747.1 hypothetical protein [Roseofilum reptotaenium CS-1145]OJJ24088.1 hypothetical protein BI308_18620 [Roseofilum reptotaenium AO1-A]